jgi:hypothetical protein
LSEIVLPNTKLGPQEKTLLDVLNEQAFLVGLMSHQESQTPVAFHGFVSA